MLSYDVVLAHLVVHQEQDAGDDLDDEEEERDAAEVVPDGRVRADRHLLVAQELDEPGDLVTRRRARARAGRRDRGGEGPSALTRDLPGSTIADDPLQVSLDGDTPRAAAAADPR